MFCVFLFVHVNGVRGGYIRSIFKGLLDRCSRLCREFVYVRDKLIKGHGFFNGYQLISDYSNTELCLINTKLLNDIANIISNKRPVFYLFVHMYSTGSSPEAVSTMT